MSVYIPPENRDTRWPLWFIHYQCRVPYVQMLSPEDLANDGLPTSGDPHHDHAMQWEPRLVGLPVHRMAELWNTGACVALVNAKDAYTIYNDIEKHLIAWKNKIEAQYNPGFVPEEDLLLLDRFATSMYEHAKPFFNAGFINAHFRIAGRSRMGRRAVAENVRKADEAAAAEIERNKENLSFKHINVVKPVGRYDPEKIRQAEQVDYSGQETIVNMPPRTSMTSMLRRRT